MLHEVQSNCRHKCCTQVLRSCANMSCLPFCAHYHETRTKRTSHVCAHRTLQRVPLNTRYTFKQSSMFNGVGINCSYVAMHKCCIECKAIVGTSAGSIYFYTYNIALHDIAWPCSALDNIALRYMTSTGTELQYITLN